MKSEAPTPLPGLIEAMRRESISLRDLYAGFAATGLIVSERDHSAVVDSTFVSSRHEGGIAKMAMAYADDLLVARTADDASRARTERLASIGEEVVDWALQSEGCYLCTRLPNGAHASTCPVGEYIAGEQRRDTDPMPAEPEITVDRTDFNGPHGPLPIGHDELEPAKESKR